MPNQLRISLGQASDRGAKEINQDFHGALIPGEPLVSTKGICFAIADGVSSSEVSQIAAESAVKGFLTDYYCTAESWSVKTSAQRVVSALNAWLYAHTQRGPHPHDMDRGYVCAFTALILKASAAHILHVGDARVYRLDGAGLELLTRDHRVSHGDESYLARALGMSPGVEIDYLSVRLHRGDIFVMATDGAHESLDVVVVRQALAAHAENLDNAARSLVDIAIKRGSQDNLTVQIVRIEELPDREAADAIAQGADLPLPPLLQPRQEIDGFVVVRELHASFRSHIYLARQISTGKLAALKIPSIDLRGDAAYLRRFMMEAWVARRVDNPHVLKAFAPSQPQTFLYLATEYIEGRTLAQWMTDHRRPELESVRAIVEQIARALQAFHRKEMLHQDVRPENILIDADGLVRLIDFGSVRVRGVVETSDGTTTEPILGTLQYTAPEYFLGDAPGPRSDLYSLAVVTYQMLTGRLPYGGEPSKLKTRAQARKLVYVSVLDDNRSLPAWLDGVLAKALKPDPLKRQEEVSQFAWELRHPPEALLHSRPWIERNPVRLWKLVCGLLVICNLVLLARVLR